MNRPLASAYASKPNSYYCGVRRDVLALLPETAHTILEVGCGTGATLEHIKRSGLCSQTIGIDIHHAAVVEAQSKVDTVYETDIESGSLPIEPNSVDVVLCLDVLEHLVDPWSVVRRLHSTLIPGGMLIASIPNVRHWRAILPLLLTGHWQYVDSGVLDRTHLRFFTRSSAISLVESSGLKVDQVVAKIRPSFRGPNTLTLRAFEPFVSSQYLIRALRTE